MGWVPIANGEAINIMAGNAYAASASVKTNHTEANIRSLVAGKGLTVYAYQEGPVSGDYRTVTVVALAAQSGASLPWAAPWPLDLLDDSHLISASVWAGAGTSQPKAPLLGALPSNNPARATTSAVFVGLGALSLASWYLWKRFR